MNSLLAIALAAQVVSANPITASRIFPSNATTVAPTSTLHPSTVISGSETFGFPATTVEFPTPYATPAPTSGGGWTYGSYIWYCHLADTQNVPTDNYTSLEPTFTNTFSFPEPTESTTGVFTDTFAGADTGFVSTATATAIATSDILTETEAETDTLFVDPEPTATSDLPIDFPTPTDFPATTDFPVITPSPTGGWAVSTHTVVGPASATRVIECFRAFD
ncbi:hypothetical protein FS749_010600 [Ceratobasidium sp. UAMH 11750]|nr:hypothetical protein FS749_010600 [Ceratobasidium sp. UAMH 11750]